MKSNVTLLKFYQVVIFVVYVSCSVVFAQNCGYQSCPKIDAARLNVHIVAHTHDDVGWLKTVDQYYYGEKSYIQKAGVQYIISSVVDELLKDPRRRFIYVETAFFKQWFDRQNEKVRLAVKKLVDNGQLEFIGGGWTMNDEAATHYQSVIDQFSWGLKYLNDTFGECGRPKIGWQIDPFGHSREFASMLAQMDYDALFLGRIDFQDKFNRLLNKKMETIWKTSSSLRNGTNLFTSVLFNTYSPPNGFCFDILCADDPIIDDKASPEYNLDYKVEKLLLYIKAQSKLYLTNNIILTMGGDFTYMNAITWYQNLDILIREINRRKDINIFYSTPSCYAKAVTDYLKKNSISLPANTGDFFPYASDSHAFWTGYFTSRPTIKRFERIGNNYLQICKQLQSIANLDPNYLAKLNVMREAMGVMQHHDAVTGTEQQHVANDYSRILAKGFDSCDLISNMALKSLSGLPSCFNSNLLLNVSQCEICENLDQFKVTIYNPQSHNTNLYVRLPINNLTYNVEDEQGSSLEAQLLEINARIDSIPGRRSKTKHELVFLAKDIPPFGFRTYSVLKNVVESPVVTKCFEEISETFIGFDGFGVIMDKSTGYITQIVIDHEKQRFSQDFLWYKGTKGDNRRSQARASGAYIFRPEGTAKEISHKIQYKVCAGALVVEIHQTFNEFVSQIVKIYKDLNYLEFDWLIGPIPVEDGVGKEIISRYYTDIENNGKFYTDSNGRETMERIRNFRPMWNVSLQENISGNYYPVTSKISINDKKGLRMSILTDRSQGGSSLRDGSIELMVHRRLLYDDAFGVVEPLNETAFNKGLVIRGSHFVIFGEATRLEKLLIQEKILSPWLYTLPLNNKYSVPNIKKRLMFSGLKRQLPKNVKILTLEPWSKRTLLLRLEHIFEKDDNVELATDVTVDLNDLFSTFEIMAIQEMSLDGNKIHGFSNFNITLSPMQIRTFLLDVKYF